MDENTPLLQNSAQKFNLHCETENKTKELVITDENISFPLRDSYRVIPINSVEKFKSLKIWPFRSWEDLFYIQTSNRQYWFQGRNSTLVERLLKEKIGEKD